MIDLLLPWASTPSPDLSPRQHCCVQQDVITPLILARAGEQLGNSSALLPSSQKPLTSLALLPGPPRPWSWGQPCSAGSSGANQQQAGPFLHLCPAFQGCRSRDTGCKTQQRIRGDCSSAGPWQQFLQDLPARASALFILWLSQPLSCCRTARAQLCPAPAPQGHPRDTTGTQGPPSLRGGGEKEGGKPTRC